MSAFRETVDQIARGFAAHARVDELEAENARLRDLVAKFQRGEPSDKFEKHGA